MHRIHAALTSAGVTAAAILALFAADPDSSNPWQPERPTTAWDTRT